MHLEAQLRPLVKRVAKAAPGQVLDQITVAVAEAEALTRLGDALVDFFVESARTAGRSWSEIGTSLGVTRQAAQQRLGRFQQVPMQDGVRQKSSPFAAWRVSGSGQVEVQAESGNAWQRLVSLDGHSSEELIRASRKADPRNWFKRLSEDLDEVYGQLGGSLASTAAAVLVDARGHQVERKVEVTIAKRRAALMHNRSARES